MKPNLVHSFTVIYRLLLRLYPRRFRDEFGQEMTAVFSEAITEAAQTTRLNLFLFCWRELRDYLLLLMREHWRNAEAKPMSTIKKRLLYLLAFIILGIVWRLYAGLLIGFSPEHNGSLLTLLTAYLPFVLVLPIVVICWLFSVTVASVIGRISPKIWLAVGLLVLVTLFLPVSIFGDQAYLMTLIIQFWVAILSIAPLLYLGVTRYSGEQVADEIELQNEGGRRTAVISLALSVLLLLKLLHKFYWLLIWDSTYDPFDFLWLIFILPAVLFAGISLSFASPERVKWVGFSYLLLMLALIMGVFTFTQQVDFRQLTQIRAERVNQALEAYHNQVGHYPQDLQQLTPRYIFSLAEPLIISGQAWCYDGGADYFRFGYVYREHWSDPRLSGNLYKAAGDIPDLQPLCWEEVVQIQEQNPRYPYEYWMGIE